MNPASHNPPVAHPRPLRLSWPIGIGSSTWLACGYCLFLLFVVG